MLTRGLLIIALCIFLKFTLGGLVPGDVLRMIEDASNDDPVQLQSGFTAYDECSSISKINHDSDYEQNYNSHA
jgi:hypothetical protein